MNKDKIKDELMIDLIEKLNNATKAYDEGTPYLTDEEWDNLYFELMDLERKCGYGFMNSPTQRVSYEVVNELTKVTHNHEMLSLAKTKDINEINRLFSNQCLLAMCKMDGLTCSLLYEDGKLVKAETRGDGIVGEDITHNALVISSIPYRIREKGRLVIDGEIICRYDDFKSFEGEYKNPRNFAAGSIRLLDSKECANRKLTFVAWDVIEGLDSIGYLSTKLVKLEDLGFTVVPYSYIFNTVDDSVIHYVAEKAKENFYPIDGIVFKINDIEYGKTLGKTSHHFNNAIAYKFYDETYTTFIKYIEWTMGRTGVLTPVAVFEPIEIDGAIVERASLHNVSIFKEMKLHYQGQKIDVFKANQIIPQIAKVHEYTEENASISGMEIPKICPICGGETSLEKSDSGTINLVCNNPNCEGKLINKLDHFCGKKGLDIKGLSKATLEKLINWEYINTCEDIFKLHLYTKEWINKPGFGVKSVEKILSAIEEASVTTLDKVISCAGIPLIGKTVSKDLANKFETYKDFRTAIDESFNFSTFDGYGPEMTKALLTFDYSELDSIVANFLTINEYNIIEGNISSNSLEGKTFVITGKLKKYKNRDALKMEIEVHGGKVAGSVTKKTDYLINNDVESTSAKNRTAKDLGIPIITEEELIKFFD